MSYRRLVILSQIGNDTVTNAGTLPDLELRKSLLRLKEIAHVVVNKTILQKVGREMFRVLLHYFSDS